MSAQKDEIEFLHALLQEARDHIGGMPTIDANGKDRFLSTLVLVQKIELALTDGAPPGATLSPRL